RSTALRSRAAPTDGHFSVEVHAVSGLECLVHTTGIEVQASFKDVDNGADRTAHLADHSGDGGWEFHHARDEPATRSGRVKSGVLDYLLTTAVSCKVRFTCDCQG